MDYEKYIHFWNTLHRGMLEGILPQNKISQYLSTTNKQQTRHEQKGVDEVD